VHPILEIGGLELRTFGLVLVAAIVLALGIAEFRARRRGFPRGSIARLAAYVLPTAWLGGQLVALTVSVADGTTREVLAGLLTSSGAWYGSLLGGMAGVFVFCRRARIRPAALLDVIVPGVAAAKVVGPVGCFLAGCDYGRRADGVPWAVTYSDRRSLVPPELWNQPLHPTALYEAIGNAVIAVGLVVFERAFPDASRRAPGLLFGAYCSAYASFRLGLEGYRGDASRGLWFGGALSTSQVISLAVLTTLAALVAVRGSRARATS